MALWPFIVHVRVLCVSKCVRLCLPVLCDCVRQNNGLMKIYGVVCVVFF